MQKIVVNAGHTIGGGPGGGAVYKCFNEGEITRLVAKALRAKLKARGFNVISADVDKASSQTEYLKKVCQIADANAGKNDLFISLHCNASTAHTGHGVECWTWRGDKLPVAVKICKNLEALGFRNRGIKNGASFYVVKNTKAKAILVEMFFLDNEKDRELFIRQGVDKIAAAIAASI